MRKMKILLLILLESLFFLPKIDGKNGQKNMSQITTDKFWNISFEDKTFLHNLDSIISLTKIEDTNHKKYLSVSIYPYISDTTRYWSENTTIVGKTDKIFIEAVAMTVPCCGEMGIWYNKKFYMFNTNIIGIFKKKNTKTIFYRKIEIDWGPYPTWKLCYDNNILELISYKYVNDEE